MPAAAWVTIILATLIIAAAALGLIRVIGHLVAVRRALGRRGRRRRRRRRARRSTVPDVLPSVNASLKPVRDFCETI